MEVYKSGLSPSWWFCAETDVPMFLCLLHLQWWRQLWSVSSPRKQLYRSWKAICCIHLSSFRLYFHAKPSILLFWRSYACLWGREKSIFLKKIMKNPFCGVFPHVLPARAPFDARWSGGPLNGAKVSHFRPSVKHPAENFCPSSPNCGRLRGVQDHLWGLFFCWTFSRKDHSVEGSKKSYVAEQKLS